MNILFTICGRAGSKGIKNKNIRDFCGKPLSYYSLAAISMYIKQYGKEEDTYDVVLNTDSEELIKQVGDNPFLKVDVIRRGEELAGDTIGKKDVILDCINKMEQRAGKSYDAAVDLDLTSPLRSVNDIKALIEKHFETSADITYSVTSARRNPYFNQVKRTDKGVSVVISSNFTCRQQAPEIYDMNASLYAYSPTHLRNGGGFSEGYFEIIEMYDTAVLDLDKEEDFELMEVIADYLFKIRPEFAEIFNAI